MPNTYSVRRKYVPFDWVAKSLGERAARRRAVELCKEEPNTTVELVDDRDGRVFVTYLNGREV